MPRCRGCNAKIDFVKLTTGKYHPVEGTEPMTYYLHHNGPGPPVVLLILADGTMLRGKPRLAHESGVLRVEGRESHFATCPAAATFRKRAPVTGKG